MSGQWITSPDGQRWFFDSGSLALDFGYTGDYGYGVAAWERLHAPGDLTAWIGERFGPLAAPATADDLAVARALRAAVCRVALAVADHRSPDAADVDRINRAARDAPPAPHLAGGREPPPRPSVRQAFAAIARDAVSTLGPGAPRVRRCAADDCALVFFDGSRPGTRRWCSMRRCGNRAKVHRHRATASGGPR